MSKNLFIEEYSGNFNDFDYFLNANIESSVINITAFLNHDRIHFDHMIDDFKCMLCSLKEHNRNVKYNETESKATFENKEYEVKMNPDEHEVIITLYHADFDTDSLIESVSFSLGYVQSYMIHGFSDSVSE